MAPALVSLRSRQLPTMGGAFKGIAESVEMAWARRKCLTIRRSVRKMSAANSMGTKLIARSNTEPPRKNSPLVLRAAVKSGSVAFMLTDAQFQNQPATETVWKLICRSGTPWPPLVEVAISSES